MHGEVTTSLDHSDGRDGATLGGAATKSYTSSRAGRRIAPAGGGCMTGVWQVMASPGSSCEVEAKIAAGKLVPVLQEFEAPAMACSGEIEICKRYWVEMPQNGTSASETDVRIDG